MIGKGLKIGFTYIAGVTIPLGIKSLASEDLKRI